MEQQESIYSAADFASGRVKENRSFLLRLERGLRDHRVHDHPVGLALAAGDYEPDAARFVFAQMLAIIDSAASPLALLIARAPDVRSRHLVLEDLWRETGRGRPEDAHPTLWRRLLRSIDVAPGDEGGHPPLASIARFHARIREELHGCPFVVACAWVAFGEAPTPSLVRALSRAASPTFFGAPVDRAYFDRRLGQDDDRVAVNAPLLIALHASREDHPAIERAARGALELQAAVLDDLQTSLSVRAAVRALGPT